MSQLQAVKSVRNCKHYYSFRRHIQYNIYDTLFLILKLFFTLFGSKLQPNQYVFTYEIIIAAKYKNVSLYLRGQGERLWA